MNFEKHLLNTKQEAFNFLNKMVKIINIQNDKKYYQITGALNKATRGSGLSTVFVAIYLFLKYIDEPQKAINIAVNTIL